MANSHRLRILCIVVAVSYTMNCFGVRDVRGSDTNTYLSNLPLCNSRCKQTGFGPSKASTLGRCNTCTP